MTNHHLSIDGQSFYHFQVWSYAVLLWELYTFAKTPYSEIEENRNVIKYICDGNRLKKPDLATKSIYNLMKKCMDKSPEKRPNFEKILNILKQIEVELIKKEKRAAKLRQKSLKKNVRKQDEQIDREQNEEENV